MAYGNGSDRSDLKRMADLGRAPLTDELRELRQKCLATVATMARAVWSDSVAAELPTGKQIDARLLPLQSRASKDGLNNVWAEKMRLLAKPAVLEQGKRRQRCLFGRLKHVDARGETPMKSGLRRLVSLPEEWTVRLADADVAALKALADGLDFRAAMALFRRLETDDAGLPEIQAAALRAMAEAVGQRFGCPEWGEDAILQLHIDYRCLRGRKERLAAVLGALTAAFAQGGPGQTSVDLAAPQPRGAAIRIPLQLPAPVAARFADCADQVVKALVLELGPETAAPKAVVLRKPRAPAIARQTVVLAEDFGFVNTSSLVVARCATGIVPEHVAFANSEPGKRATKEFLAGHVSGDEVEILERVQLSGRKFLDRIKVQAARIDQLRSEIDRGYNRLGRLKAEINRLAGREPTETVPVEPETVSASNSEQARYASMHGRFFRLLAGLGKLKARRRAIYRSVAGLKTSWFGHVANIRTRLADAYGAVVASEDLSFLAVEKKDPDYKGRTFNRMINNGSRGQYTRRADDKLDWRGIARILLPSYYTSSTDWRTGTVDKTQRKDAWFTAADGTRWDADLHAAETLARWLFLRPKPAGSPAL
ncbi:transposase [Cereibacter sphaeroides]|uniref:transposase n=1 Tax=Cereibacter sphaeroides TaxID=1063 RepID=UPI001F292618|nr:transposase [Cereibacter sphaeroides]MCE6958725.1 transposase [Cereibacter sphaeroides]MCE6973401.1 transposase [Cereibacter sphaeroides]